MQLQVECNRLSSQQSRSCQICDQSIEMREARVILCDDQGTNCGEVCSQCIGMGFDWLNYRFQQLNRSHRGIQNGLNQKLDDLVGV
jgi:hypothetical protein